MNSDETNHYEDEESLYRIIAAVYRIVGQAERRFDSLRDADRDAVRLSHDDLARRLEGFPQQYATKVEMEQAAMALRRLENTALGREVYEQRHEALKDEVDRIEKDKLDELVFQTFLQQYRTELARNTEERNAALSRTVFDSFVEQYRLDQDRAGVERRDVAQVLANATNQVRDQIIQERGDFLTQEAYDQRHQVLVQQVDAVERWQYKIVGALVFATFIAPLVTGIVVYTITKSF